MNVPSPISRLPNTLSRAPGSNRPNVSANDLTLLASPRITSPAPSPSERNRFSLALTNSVIPSTTSLSAGDNPAPNAAKARSVASPKLLISTLKLPSVLSVAPPKRSSKPSVKFLSIWAAPSAVFPNSPICSLASPIFCCKISNTGIPRSASLFKSSRPKPPAVDLANKSVMACNAPKRSVDVDTESLNVCNSLVVGVIPAPCSLMYVWVKSSTLKAVLLAKP